MSTRKRRAPGASPQAPSQTYQQDIPTPNDAYMNWNDPAMSTDLSGFDDPSLYDTYGAGMTAAGGGGGHNRVVSLEDGAADMNMGQQLVRRNPNQQLAPAPRRNQWDGYPSPSPQWEAVDDIEELEQKAAVAKKDAQLKRKQIPPFVQKLSSFLDNNKNENLIRWSDDGNSFIVLDEDEFARTLIPELFKHNNYASFVRQLNMYGFHKKVGLSDNSMKASETKAKAPSEYFNKYFKRGRPELLWLIQKPKNPTAGPKRKREDEGKGDSDDERKYVQDTGGGGYVEELAVRGNEQMAMIPRSEYNSLRVEVRELQQQQKLISNVLTQIKRQNEELYSRATSFQALHDRHENSINAILTFLATFYNRSLEGNANGMNLADMFPAARQQPHGNVVDVDDFPPPEPNKSPMLQRSKRPLAILPAPPTTQQDLLSPMVTGRATTMSPTTRPIPSPITRPGSRQSAFKPSIPPRQQSAYPVSQGKDDLSSLPLKVESPSTLSPLPENDAIMSAIQNANANAGQTSQAPQFDYAAALSNYQTQDGNVPLTAQQRNDALSVIANNISAQNTNNALTNPDPPEMSNLINDLVQYQATQQQLELLQKMSDQQNARVQRIQERIQPLSPSGQIPGMEDTSYFGNTGIGEPGQYDLDFDALVQDQDYFPNNNNNNVTTQANGNNNVANGLPDFNFDTPSAGFDGTSADAFNFNPGVGEDDSHLHVAVDDGVTENRIESLGSSNATSPAATVEEVEDETRRRRSPKRRKK
ncbi:heat shock factor protein HSF8 [Cucurbitaria berberidis CBS 394.84]|uniref:Heat shock factor protein HSF8 n=1 Tax=Cucurbitaria berberidis CBS 394.84 TaxID=1168544 RepID=A0A9P4LCK8_9PLEO|nr:heat shock factor protein HSF8 [Cucurbitaria berberidis CBS 394.84]KAF1850866.1 heat shock factor protein HSF8 [Cucurbitaria berberidis CBS 394.84]